MSRSSQRPHRLAALPGLAAVRRAASLVSLLGAAFLATLLASLGAGAATAPAALADDAPTPVWHIVLQAAWTRPDGLPASNPLPAGLRLTISSIEGSGTCQPTPGPGTGTGTAGQALACTFAPAGFAVPRGGTYRVTASGLPAATNAGNVGAFTTLTQQPGAQCTPGHGGLLDPCHHLVVLRAAEGPATDGPAAPSPSNTGSSALPSGATPAGPGGAVGSDDGSSRAAGVAGDGDVTPAAGTSRGLGVAAQPAPAEPRGAAAPAAGPGKPAAATRPADAAAEPAGVLPGADDPAAPGTGRLARAAATAVPDVGGPDTVVVLAGIGVFACGVAALTLVRAARRHGRDGHARS